MNHCPDAVESRKIPYQWSGMKITYEAVEAAVDAIVASKLGDHSGINGEEFVEAAHAALEAAAPHMLAAAWDDGHESGFSNGRLSQLPASYDAPRFDIGAEHAKVANPYRPAK